MKCFRPHRLHAVHGMWPISTDIARSIVCVSVHVCALVTRVSCAKTAKPIEMLFGGRLHGCNWNHAWGPDSPVEKSTYEGAINRTCILPKTATMILAAAEDNLFVQG